LQDLYPEVAEAFGVLRSGGLPARFIRNLRDSSLRKAVINIAIGERMADLLRRRGVAEGRITVIPNMTDDESIRPINAADNPLRREWGFAPGDLVVGYSGNLGRAHEVDTILDAAAILQAEGRSDISFLVIGGGFLRGRLEGEIAARSLTCFVLKPYQPRESLHLSLTVPDVHWVTLLPELEGLIVPSKFYGAAASGRPVVFIGSPEGELGAVIPAGDCGAVVAIGEAEQLARQLAFYADNPDARLAQGRRARELVQAGFNRAAVFAQWGDFAERFAPRG
jgi:glycosyltransferase involved in cell wall biosynthesis